MGVDDYIRKYKWHSILSGGNNNNFSCNRFFISSGRHPPDRMVPQHVLNRCKLLRNVIISKLRQCNSCYPNDNLSPPERAELNVLASRRDIVVTPVDKGGKWCIIPKDEYLNEGYRQLSNDGFYLPTTDSLSDRTGMKLRQFLNYLHKRRFITLRELRGLLPPTQPRERSFYLLPKIHKPTWPTSLMPPGRPIVSDCDSISRKCASFVEFFLAPVARSLPSYVRDSLHVISIIKDLVLNDNAILFTLDVRSLYTNIPNIRGIEAVGRAFHTFKDERRPDLTVLSMMRLLLTSNDFLFNNERFLQINGTAMGCAFGGSYASIFLGEWENKITDLPLRPSLWIRYIDDVFGIWNHSEDDFLNFVNIVNNFDVNIHVDMSFNRFSIRFLDLELYKCNNRLCYRIGFKATDSFRILTSDSYHPPHVFENIIYGQLYRFITRSSTYEDFKSTKKIVQKHWRNQGYSRSFIRSNVKKVLCYTGQKPEQWDTGFHPCTNVNCTVCKYGFYTFSLCQGSNTYPILHRLTCDTQGAIYLIVCKRCHIRYVGETSRCLKERMKEHISHICNKYPTPVSSHFSSACDLSDFSFTSLEHASNNKKRKVREQQWIRRLSSQAPNGLNTICQINRPIHLVLPYSECSGRVVRVCQDICSEINTVGSMTTGQNLRSLFKQ